MSRFPLGRPGLVFLNRLLLRRLTKVAELWQEYLNRDLDSAMGRVKEELEEFFEATSKMDKLDELGDVAVNLLRALSSLTTKELIFVCKVMEMKIRRRTNQGKDKKAERILTLAFAEAYLGG